MLADDNLVSILLQSFTLVKTSKFSSDNSLAGSGEVEKRKAGINLSDPGSGYGRDVPCSFQCGGEGARRGGFSLCS